MALISTTDVVASSTSDASKINSNFLAVKGCVNGFISNVNFNSSAAMLLTQFEYGSNGEVLSTAAGQARWMPGWTRIAEATPTTQTTTFSSIPTHFTHLRADGYTRGSQSVTSEDVSISLNGDTGNDYVAQNMTANNTTTGGTATGKISAGAVATHPAGSATANLFGTWSVVFDNVQSGNVKVWSGALSTLVTTIASGGLTIFQWSGLWTQTNAITSIEFRVPSGNFVTNSKITLWGLAT